MSFTLRLTADLTFALAARALTKRRSSSPILRLSADENLDLASDSNATKTQPAQILSPRHLSPIVWIGGPEPLDNFEVARLSNALAASGRHVFLETSGASLKPRLHEFRPSSRFYFVVRFNALTQNHGGRDNPEDAFSIGLEAVRMSRLAGFFTCANLVFHSNIAATAVVNLHCEIRKLDIDGFLITPAALTPELEAQVHVARRRFLTRRWALLSSLLDQHASDAHPRNSLELSRESAPESQRNRFGEGVEAG